MLQVCLRPCISRSSGREAQDACIFPMLPDDCIEALVQYFTGVDSKVDLLSQELLRCVLHHSFSDSPSISFWA